MKLLYRITLRVSAAVLLLFAVWGTVFYFIIIDEINDETDDTLEDYSEYIITRILSGETPPGKDHGTNNTYYITEVERGYASENPTVRFSNEDIYIYSKHETEPARILKTIFRDSDDRYYELTVLIPTIEKKDLERTILLLMIALYVVLLVSVAAINAIVLRQFLKPLYTLLDWLDNFSLDRELSPLELRTDTGEFRKLADSLVKSAQRNIEMYEQQSLFIGHASHELQTPIAVAKNRLEMLAEDPGLTEYQLEQVLKTQRSLKDIARLNQTLLLLTKIENDQFPENSDVDVNGMVLSLSGDLAEAFGYLDLDVSVEDAGTLTVRMNEMLARVLVSNLLKNAFIHNRPGGTVSVKTTSTGVSVSNTAVSGALNPEYIFRRFYHAGHSESSAGLGLSLVESIAKRYGITVSYSYEEEMHTFRAEFPAAMIITG